jgi:serine/threonine protein kinase/tetratricopeptide (TPR) repeat protein
VTDTLFPLLERTLGPGFRLERELGGGGMSRVFLAHELALGRPVVVKVLPPSFASEVSVERFRREMQIGAQLQHAHIVPVLSAGAASGDGEPFLYYTMPFIAGESLRERIDRDGALPVNDAVRVWRELLDALAHAHARGVVHRDVKPANVLLDGSHAFVTDFGIARAVQGAGDARMTGTGIALGTPAYMAPEQALGEAHVDARADVYAAGVMMYEMLTGTNPFAGTNTRDTILAQLSRTPPALAVSGLTPRLADLVMRCIEKDPKARPSDARAVLAELDSIVESRETSAIRSRSHRPAPRAMAVAGGVIAILAGAAWFARSGNLPLGSSGPAHDSLRLTVVVSEVTHDSGDSTLARAYTDAVLAELARDPWINVVTPALAREIAQLYGLEASVQTRDTIIRYAKQFRTSAFLQLGISKAGAGYLFTAGAVGARNDNPIGVLQQSAADAAAVPQAMNQIARALRRKIVTDRALLPPTIQTAIADDYSAEALRLFAQGSALQARGDVAAAAERFGQALAIDSTFAIAALNQSTMLRFSGAPRSRWIPPLVAAYRHRMRVRSAVQRDLIVAEYMRNTGRPEESLKAYESAMRIPWLESDMRNNMALAYEDMRRVDLAARLFEGSIDTTDKRLGTSHGNLVRVLAKAGDVDSVKAVVARMTRADSTAATTRRGRYMLAIAARDWAELGRLTSADLRDKRGPLYSRSLTEARSLALTRGQLAEFDSLEHVRGAEARDGLPGVYLESELNRALVRVSLIDDTAGARAIVDSALAIVSWHTVPALDRPYGLAIQVAGLTRGRAPAAALAAEWSRETPAELKAMDSLLVVRALGDVALATDDAGEALRLFRIADADDCIVCMYPRLARAYDRLGQADSARVYYERFVTRPYSTVPGSTLARAYRRLAELYEERRDWTSAAKRYQDFVNLWANADPPLRDAVRDARGRLERLRTLAR